MDIFHLQEQNGPSSKVHEDSSVHVRPRSRSLHSKTNIVHPSAEPSVHVNSISPVSPTKPSQVPSSTSPTKISDKSSVSVQRIGNTKSRSTNPNTLSQEQTADERNLSSTNPEYLTLSTNSLSAVYSEHNFSQSSCFSLLNQSGIDTGKANRNPSPLSSTVTIGFKDISSVSIWLNFKLSLSNF